VFSSGCHSFWRNDFFQPLYEAHSGVILLGAMREVAMTLNILERAKPKVSLAAAWKNR
jgi:hypothetical protein